MNRDLLDKLSEITLEEEKIQQSRLVNKEIYTKNSEFIADADKLIGSRHIDIRTHTRFVHFPQHRHNYIEMVYMCKGNTVHIIDGKTVHLSQGELLILNQNAVQEILPAGKDDVAINFMIKPEFFDKTLSMLTSSMLREFIANSLKGEESKLSYIHFKVATVLTVQNLIENLLWSIANEEKNSEINEITMGLLFLQLMKFTDKISETSFSEKIVMELLKYIEDNYKDGSLNGFLKERPVDIATMSKIIKKQTGLTFLELMQKRRMKKAENLLTTTNLSVLDISLSVGYENFSFFHRLFKRHYGTSPYKYRKNLLTNANTYDILKKT